MIFSTHLLSLASSFQKIFFLIFGYLLPALSSVKAVVHKDSEGYHQWATYWLILHLYLTVLSPILHLTLHPLFELLTILWLSLPRYQGASVVYEHLVVPWVDKYEVQVDGAVEEAHRGIRRWVLARVARVVCILIGEGFGSVLDGARIIVAGIFNNDEISGSSGQSKKESTTPEEDLILQSSTSTESLPPRHSVKEALSQSSIDDLANDENELSYTENQLNDFVRDFMSMLRQGLYVFANVEVSQQQGDDDVEGVDAHDERVRQSIFESGFKLGVFSYKGPLDANRIVEGEFMLSPALGDRDLAGSHEGEHSSIVSMPLVNFKDLNVSGSQGLLVECQFMDQNGSMDRRKTVKAEIVLSDENDRDILLNGLKLCLGCI